MAIQGSGAPISFQDIKDEFGAETNSNIGFYRQTFSGSQYGELTFNGISEGIPTSGELKFSNFYGKRLNIVVNYFSGNSEEKPQTARARYNAQNVTVVGEKKSRPSDTSGSKVIIHVNKDIGSNKSSETSCALRTGNTWEAGTELQIDVGNGGRILGAGGDGGNGSEGSGSGKNGKKGSSGLGIQFGTSSNKTVVNIKSGGLVSGGYGGGGGGGGGHDHDKNSEKTASGGGGGGGAGYPPGNGGARGEGGTRGGAGGNGSKLLSGNGGSASNNGNEAYGGRGGHGGDHEREANPPHESEDGAEGEGGEGSGGAAGERGGDGEGIRVTGASNTVTINNSGTLRKGISYNVSVT